MILLSPDSIFYFDVLVVFLSTLFIYNFHRLVKNRQLNSFSVINVGDDKGLLNPIMSAVSLLFLIPCFYYFDSWHWSIFIAGGIIALAYSLPLFSVKGFRYSLRTMPYTKLFVVVIVWVLMTVLLPINIEDFERPEVILLLLERICFLLAITLPFDIRDMDQDRAQGVTTIPLKFGWTRSIGLSYIFLSLFSIVVLLGYHNSFHNTFQTSMLIISALITFVVVKKLKPNGELVHYTLYLEGTSLMQSLLIWFSYLALSFI